jgi:hypothetical protein
VLNILCTWILNNLQTKQPNMNLEIRQAKSTYIYTHFLHVVSLMTGPYPLEKRVRHIVPYSASSFNFQRPSCSCLRLLPCLSVTSVLPSILLWITCFRRQFLRKMWPFQLLSLRLYICSHTYINLCKIYCFIVSEASPKQGKAIFDDGTPKFETETQAMTSARRFFLCGGVFASPSYLSLYTEAI